MTEEKDIVTIEERYIRATKSSHLEMAERNVGDVDYLIAAGLSRGVFGAMLFRLRREFDEVRGDLDRVRHSYVPHSAVLADAHEEAARQQEAMLMIPVPKVGKVRAHGPTQAVLLQDRATAMREQVDRDRRDAILQARAFALLQMKTLHRAVEAMGRWSVVQATKQAFMVPDADVLRLAGRVLEAWVDPRCDSCNGTGRRAAGGKSAQKCRACSGSGKRSTKLGKSVEERLFTRHLLAQMDGMAAESERRMRQLTSTK